MDAKLLKETEAKIRKTHAGELDPISSAPLVRDLRRAAVAPAVDAALAANKHKK